MFCTPIRGQGPAAPNATTLLEGIEMSLFLPSLLCLAVAGAGSSASIDDGTRAEQAPPLHSWNADAVASVARSDDRQAPEDKPLVEKPALQLGPHKIYFGLEVLFGSSAKVPVKARGA
jgi:hypothetical protein